MSRQCTPKEPTQPNFLSQCCGAAPSPLTPDVSADDLTGKCAACHDNAVFRVDPDPADWRTHTHESNDPWAYQHGPNMHTHGTDGKVDTVMGDSISSEKEITTCNSCCTSPRLCRQYRGLWLCLSGPFNCYRYREIIYANKQEEKGS